MSKECVRYVHGRFFLNDSGLTVEAKFCGLLQEFLNWFLLGKQDTIYSLGQGAAQRNLNAKRFADLFIPLPPLSDQRRIAATLDKICGIIEKRKAQLAQLQQLVKSRFVEMFGDPMANPMRWPIVAMNEVLEGIGNGRSFVCESSPRIGENPAILKLGAATWGEYRPEENKALKPGDSFSPACEVKAGDLLFTRKRSEERRVGKEC